MHASLRRGPEPIQPVVVKETRRVGFERMMKCVTRLFWAKARRRLSLTPAREFVPILPTALAAPVTPIYTTASSRPVAEHPQRS